MEGRSERASGEKQGKIPTLKIEVWGTHETAKSMKHKCPLCKRPTDSAVHGDFPFCSERCRDRDLGNWATEKYVVSEPIFNEDDSEEGDRKTIILDLPERDEAGQ